MTSLYDWGIVLNVSHTTSLNLEVFEMTPFVLLLSRVKTWETA